jgi:hypothetical protein
VKIWRRIWVESARLLPENGRHCGGERTNPQLAVAVEDESAVEGAVEVLAVAALAVLAAEDACLEAFTVLLEAA